MKIKAKRKLTLLTVFILVSIVLTACNTGEPTIDIEAQKTGFAQTAQAQATMTAEAIPTLTPTPELTATPTATATVAESTEETPAVTETVTGPTATVATGGTDSAAWRANDPPDNTVFSPGEEFTVTWTIENTGSSTWSTGYYINFSTGDQMGAEEKINLPYAVPPGTNVQIAVNFVAPDSKGTKQSNWVLKNANDETFYTFFIVVEVQ